MVRQLRRQRYGLVVAHLRDEDDASDLLDPIIVRRRDAVQIPGDLRPQIGNGHEFREDVLRQDVRIPRIFDIITIDVDVVRP